MNTTKIVEGVLEQYVGMQVNLDSQAARTLLAEHIASEIEETHEIVTDYIDDDLQI